MKRLLMGLVLSLYPYGEVDGKPLDYFTAMNFGYTVMFTAD